VEDERVTSDVLKIHFLVAVFTSETRPGESEETHNCSEMWVMLKVHNY
jgi:hypothetical protein